ncbi:methylamine utilization protein MauE, partial [Streptomyces triticirhizae]
MTSLLAAVATGVTLLALLAGCAGHVTRPGLLPEALAAHRLLPPRAVAPAARAVTAAEG